MKRLIRQAGLCLSALLLTAAAYAGETTNRYGITMVDIPSGSFVMGSCVQDKKAAFLGESSCGASDGDASSDESPQHTVRVKAFQMGKTEVTLGQFKQFIKATGNSQLVDDDFIKYNAYGDDAPVVLVSWHDAQAFVKWLNQTDGGGWRLPSEAEWEYACRANMGSRFCTQANDLFGGCWSEGNSGGRQRPVAQKTPNAFGLYDMSGNVWEWVQDCWHQNYNGAPTDGSAWTTGCYNDRRVLRGGSWYNFARIARAAIRYFSSPDIRYNYIGFRLARTR